MLKPNERLLNDEPGAAGGGAAPAAAPVAAPAADPAAAPATDAAAAASAEPADPFAGLTSALDAVGADPAAAPAPAQPRVAGKFAAASQVAAGVAASPVPTPAPTPAPTAAPAAAKPGDLDLTPPEGMSERAQARWGQLTERAKQVPVLEQRATEAENALGSVRKLVASAGLQPQEFAEVLEVSRLARSSNPQDAQRALQMLDAQRAQLATRLGIDAPGVDVLAGHADLKQKVDGMLMTREDALEIVRLRNAEQQNQRATQATNAAAQDHARHVQAVNNAAASMERTLASRAGTPGHEAKVQYIMGHFASPENLQRFVTTYHPQQWESALLTMYEAFNPPAPAPAPPQPLRPGNVGTGALVRSGPVTAESAVDKAFAAAGL